MKICVSFWLLLAGTTAAFAATPPFEGKIAIALTRGTETNALLYTVGPHALRIANVATNWPHPVNIVDLESGALTLVYPHNRSFVRLGQRVASAVSAENSLPARRNRVVTADATPITQGPGVGPRSGIGVSPVPTGGEAPGQAGSLSHVAPPSIGPTNLPGVPAPPPMPPMPAPPAGLPPGIGPQPSPSGIGVSPVSPDTAGTGHAGSVSHMPPGVPPGIGPQPGAGPGIAGMPTMPMMPPMPMPGMAEKLELKATTNTMTMLGFQCIRYDLKQRSETLEIWATDKLFPFQAYRQNQPPRFGPRMIEEQWPDMLKEKKLFPLLVTLRYDNGTERFRFEVNSVKEEKIADPDGKLFQPPPDYHELEPLPF